MQYQLRMMSMSMIWSDSQGLVLCGLLVLCAN
jgi:hypothetical protein